MCTLSMDKDHYYYYYYYCLLFRIQFSLWVFWLAAGESCEFKLWIRRSGRNLWNWTGERRLSRRRTRGVTTWTTGVTAARHRPMSSRQTMEPSPHRRRRLRLVWLTRLLRLLQAVWMRRRTSVSSRQAMGPSPYKHGPLRRLWWVQARWLRRPTSASSRQAVGPSPRRRGRLRRLPLVQVRWTRSKWWPGRCPSSRCPPAQRRWQTVQLRCPLTTWTSSTRPTTSRRRIWPTQNTWYGTTTGEKVATWGAYSTGQCCRDIDGSLEFNHIRYNTGQCRDIDGSTTFVTTRVSAEILMVQPHSLQHGSVQRYWWFIRVQPDSFNISRYFLRSFALCRTGSFWSLNIFSTFCSVFIFA